MISVKTESILANGQVRRRYKVTLTDLLGNLHTEIVGMFNHDANNDGLEVETQLLTSKKEQETEQYKSDVSQGTNPFTKDSIWNTRSELLKTVLDDALSLPATDPIVYNGLPYLQFITDIELMALYSKDQVWVDSVRLKATSLLVAREEFNNYQAVL